MDAGGMRVGIDVGGTFTDLVAVDVRSGERTVVKVASTPQAPERAVLDALDRLRRSLEPSPEIDYLAHSTTIATNALLGQVHLELPRVAFLTTEGFRDVIEIGRQNRSEVYNLFVTRPKPLVAREDRIPVRERMDHAGNAIVPLDRTEIDRVVTELRARNVASAAIGFLHSYANPDHERRLGEALRAAFPQIPITLSCEVDPEYREYERFSTAVVNAALAPIVQHYLECVMQGLRERGIDAPLHVMQSNGGTARADRIAARPSAIVESGPASGVIAAAHLAAQTGARRVLSFDMGGTTAKAGTVVDGVVQIANEFEAAGATHSGRSTKGSGYPVRFPFVDLAEVSAGGGTIAWVDDAGGLHVGPTSAGADPGPACYGASEAATVTDANVVLGRLNPRALVGGTFPIDARRSHDAVRAIADRLHLSVEAAAAGIVRIVDAQMAKVLRIVTVERGLDPRDFTLVAFGGNGPLHACALAAEIGITRAIVPAHPGVFSAFGLLIAPMQASLVRPIMQETTLVDRSRLETIFAGLEASARSALREQGVADDAVRIRKHYDARYRGQSFELDIEHDESGPLERAFHRAHARRYGYASEAEPVEIVNARLNATGSVHALLTPPSNGRATLRNAPETRDVWIDSGFQTVPIYQRAALPKTFAGSGPLVVEEYDATTYVPPGWELATEGDTLALTRPAAPMATV